MREIDSQCAGKETEAGATSEVRISLLRVAILLIPALVVFLFVLSRHIPQGHRPSPQCQFHVNMRNLEQTKATWAWEYKKLPGEVPQSEDLFGKGHYIVQNPVCS